MWTFGSERRLIVAAWSTVALLCVGALLFGWAQNRYRPVGGDISWSKLFWLLYAVTMWFALPVLLSADPRLSPRWRRPFALLAALMLARGVVELWMLYVALNWSPWYGIGQDLACMTMLAVFIGRLSGSATNATERTVFAHALVTGLIFLPEMYFAWYMQVHFTTTGEAAIYFVPDDPRYRDVLGVTTVVVLFLSAYLPVFLFRWLHGTPDRAGSAAA
jgi:hypothetical protein